MIDANIVFDTIASACHVHHSQGYLTKEHEELIVQVSDIILAIENLEFTEDILVQERCAFLLDNREFFQVYADSKNNPELRKFSLDDLREVALADSMARSALVDAMIERENIPFYRRSAVKKALFATAAICVVVGAYQYGINPLTVTNDYIIQPTYNFGKDYVVQPSYNLAKNYIWEPLSNAASNIYTYFGTGTSKSPITILLENNYAHKPNVVPPLQTVWNKPPLFFYNPLAGTIS